jgi:hypothetical protein
MPLASENLIGAGGSEKSVETSFVNRVFVFEKITIPG